MTWQNDEAAWERCLRMHVVGEILTVRVVQVCDWNVFGETEDGYAVFLDVLGMQIQEDERVVAYPVPGVSFQAVILGFDYRNRQLRMTRRESAITIREDWAAVKRAMPVGSRYHGSVCFVGNGGWVPGEAVHIDIPGWQFSALYRCDPSEMRRYREGQEFNAEVTGYDDIHCRLVIEKVAGDTLHS